ncbi:hypothetical protein HY373_00980 [Candidatus Berkelbacteria bacterium]|nr:hypothetical protein [Candidatus Berkelbacteria bacterium]
MLKKIAIVLVVMSLFKIDIIYTGQPMWMLWGNPEYIHYDPDAHFWVNENTLLEHWRWSEKNMPKPEQVPEGKRVVIKFSSNPFWRRENPMAEIQTAMACAVIPNRRLKLVNVEQSINEIAEGQTQYRVWPHLGILYIGTVANAEGWDVALHDELVEGYVNLERIVQPGDVVGLSLVVTGMERGVELARQAKRLGASYVIAGNDSAIFRADQLLQLPDHPIDAVFTTNSLTAVRQFLQQVGLVELNKLNIPGVAVVPTGINRSNERHVLQAEREIRLQLRRQAQFDPQDVFVVPKLSLFGEEYWQKVWQNYRATFGHKHNNPTEVRNALALFAQGCTRTGTADVCSYCTIAGVADIRVPTTEYLKQVLEAYQSFGINYVFNVTDSAFEMRHVSSALKNLGAFFPEGLMIYGRAWGLAHHPQLIDEWLSLTGGRLLVNVGMDSGDERILSRGVIKASQLGSRLEENRQAVRNLAANGAHLHYSLIFGSPGETRETCEKSLEFFEWTRSVLRGQLDQCEPDIYWLNHGAPASRVFHDYSYAQQLASLAGKEISRETWEHRFHRHRDTLIVPWECEEAWYDCFTSITVEEAQKCNAQVASAMAGHGSAAPGRAFRPI